MASPSCCTKCNLTFSSRNALCKHEKKSHQPPSRCAKCNLTFLKRKALYKHDMEVHRPLIYCPICDRTFREKKAFRKHKRKAHPLCGHCNKRQVGRKELQSHQQATGHLCCRQCDIYFLDNSQYFTHVRNVQHTTQYHCCDCDREYGSQELLDNHCCNCDIAFSSQIYFRKHLRKCTQVHNSALGAKAPDSKLNGSLLWACERCIEKFASRKILRKHLSSKHRDIRCPVGAKCSKKFVTPSALLNHLESGHCRSGMTRAKMAELVIAHDPNCYITSTNVLCALQDSPSQIPNPASPVAASQHSLLSTEFPFPPHLLEINDEDTTSEWSLIDRTPPSPIASEGTSEWSLVRDVPLTPDIIDHGSEWSFAGVSLVATSTPSNIPTSNPNRTPSHSVVAESPRNLRCPYCPPHRKPFGSTAAFQAHIASAAHAPKIFHCPLSLMPGAKLEDLLKRRNFSTLAGLTQHLASGGCTGGVELYKKAIEFVQEQLDGLGFAGVRLLSL